MLAFYSKILDFKVFFFLMFAYFDWGKYSFTVVTVINAMELSWQKYYTITNIYRAQTFFVFYCFILA